MRITIIPSDNYVSVDNDNSHYPLDLSSCLIPSNIHALQWYDSRGWVEFIDPIDPFSSKQQNEEIIQLPQWANNCIEVYNSWTPPIVETLSEPTEPQPTSSVVQ